MTAHRLLNDKLYSEVLVDPANVADHLQIVSGYATPAMLGRVLKDLPQARISLVVGMVGSEGVPLGDHKGFMKIQAENSARLEIAYTKSGTSVHTKLYVWSRAGVPTIGFAGSSNFTQNGFLIARRRSPHSEVLSSIDPGEGLAEFDRVSTDAISITDPNLSRFVKMRLHSLQPVGPLQPLNPNATPDLSDAPSVLLPLVRTRGKGKGHPHDGWGLNWGQRDSRSSKSEAGIPVPVAAWRSAPGFFPTGVPGNRPYFVVTTDDRETMLMVVAEQNDKVLHSVPNNAEIGKWFRRRLGVVNDAPVSIDDLRHFGSRFVKIYRLGDETYHLTFDSGLEAAGRAQYGLAPM